MWTDEDGIRTFIRVSRVHYLKRAYKFVSSSDDTTAFYDQINCKLQLDLALLIFSVAPLVLIFYPERLKEKKKNEMENEERAK